MATFFDAVLADSGNAGFIREDKIDDALRKLIPRAHLSKGKYSYPSRSELRDLVWNHMDQNHRPFVHRTYDSASRIFINNHASLSLTRFGNWPVIIPVFDGYFKKNGFYQVMVLFGLIAVLNIIECNADDEGAGTRMDVSWTIASHRWLRFLHPLLNRRFLRLNEVQNREDDPIRDRRIALRAAGYRFKTDAPDFINSNVIENNTIFPLLTEAASISLDEIPNGNAVQVAIADRAFLLRRDGDAVDVWPGVCPHEGAALGATHIQGRTVKCPWHGLEFAGRRLVNGASGITVCGANLVLTDGTIGIRPSAGTRA